MGYLINSCVAAICVFAAYYLIKLQRQRSLARANGCRPPKQFPHKEPILGLDLFFKAGTLFKENRYLPELMQRYHNNGRTFETKSLGLPAINSIAPENLQAVFSSRSKDWGVEPIRLPAQAPFCGRGFITTDGPAWEHSRTLLKPSFNRANIADLSTLENCLRITIGSIPKDGSSVDLQSLFSNLYLETAMLFLFGVSTGSLSGATSHDSKQFLEAFDYAMFGSGFRIALGPFKFLFRDRKWLESCKTTHRFVDTYVDMALRSRQELPVGDKLSSGNHDNPQRHILLHAMAEQTNKKTELRNESLQALMAAQETTAILISNVFFVLSRHLSVWQQLRVEVLSLKSQELNFDLLQNMKYLRKVLNETLRLYPVFPQMNRVALTETTLPVGGGSDGTFPIYVPSGTIFDTCFYVLHRLPSIWGADAHEFKPDRWDTFKPQTWEYVPFGGGLRGCMGRQKALMEASYVIVRMLQEFSHIESRDERDWTGQVQLTAKNANGCKVALTPV